MHDDMDQIIIIARIYLLKKVVICGILQIMTIYDEILQIQKQQEDDHVLNDIMYLVMLNLNRFQAMFLFLLTIENKIVDLYLRFYGYRLLVNVV